MIHSNGFAGVNPFTDAMKFFLKYTGWDKFFDPNEHKKFIQYNQQKPTPTDPDEYRKNIQYNQQPPIPRPSCPNSRRGT